MLQSKQSEAFLAVAEMGSFELAAEKLCITASAVTLRVQSLEKSLGHILIIRERPCRVTHTGQELLQYLQHSRLMQQSLMQHLMGKTATSEFYKVTIASNADSLATWLLPALQEILLQQRIALELKIEDQTQTHTLLEAGLVNACISTENQAMKGCLAQPLGKMIYRMVATPEFCRTWFQQGINRASLKVAPAVIFNHKDHIHTEIMQKHFGLKPNTYPCHYIPSSTAFVEAIQLGLGFGMLPEFQIGNHLVTGELIEIIPEASTEIILYWHHWKRQSAQLEQLTCHILQKAQQTLN
ncbi:LysR family transcriptional regulator ArgP [Acinetobacter silvestris]|uniref:HTH lysR-type domain-containing protein n=1 Tax=Acinetobacter silvestris TaxID=1977882 RepID=A0A1Y3CK89_9GAMM|nr:LysR family transcriptional regulator ArgP [Acinetobacter silvestris]OTG66563.1 hypothetical protein B9T28_04765 [Acinetobacter silvestris]